MPENINRESEEHYQKLMDCLVRVINASVMVESVPVMIGDLLLYSSEVHLIDTIARFPDENISQVARRLGVTKGAVSQISRKLEGKGCLIREKEEGNQKNICLRLSNKGRTAFEWHRTLHERTNIEMKQVISGMNPSDIQNLLAVLSAFEKTINGSLERRGEHTAWFLENYPGERTGK